MSTRNMRMRREEREFQSVNPDIGTQSDSKQKKKRKIIPNECDMDEKKRGKLSQRNSTSELLIADSQDNITASSKSEESQGCGAGIPKTPAQRETTAVNVKEAGSITVPNLIEMLEAGINMNRHRAKTESNAALLLN
ncbi:hypothetical protein CBL_14320 [Carabus blaptoides fortunei]